MDSKPSDSHVSPRLYGDEDAPIFVPRISKGFSERLNELKIKKRDSDEAAPRPKPTKAFSPRAQATPPTQQKDPRIIQTTVPAPTFRAPVTRGGRREGVRSTLRPKTAAPDPSSNGTLREQWLDIRPSATTASASSLARKEQINAFEADKDGFVYVENPKVQKQIDGLLPPRLALPEVIETSGSVYEGGLKVVETVGEDGDEEIRIPVGSRETINGNVGPNGGLKTWVRPLGKYFGRMVDGARN